MQKCIVIYPPMAFSNPELTNPRIHVTLLLLATCTESGAVPPTLLPLHLLALYNYLLCEKRSTWLAMKTSSEWPATCTPTTSPSYSDICLSKPRVICIFFSDLHTLYSVFLMQTHYLPEPAFHFLKRMNTAFSLGPVYSITSISPSGLVLFLLIQCPK